MTLLSKDMRDIVISLMKIKNINEIKIKCVLYGLDFEFVKGYYPIANIEKGWEEGRYFINSISHPPKNKSKIILYITDVDYVEMNEWNASFGVTDPDLQTEFNLEIPSKYYSEWLVEMLGEHSKEFLQ